MSNRPELIVMLTHNDFTVSNAAEIFEQCRNSRARYWGFKEHPLPLPEMKALYARMKECGMTTFLEVVAYSEDEGLAGAHMAIDCGVDVLMGTTFSEKILALCQQHGLRYMPFVGHIEGRPSVLSGSIEEMVAEARDYVSRGAYGIDLLGYRYVGDPVALNKAMVEQVPAPVCLAGSIDSFNRLDEVLSANPWSFTIGSAFFENGFGGTFAEQINKVCEYIK